MLKHVLSQPQKHYEVKLTIPVILSSYTIYETKSRTIILKQSQGAIRIPSTTETRFHSTTEFSEYLQHNVSRGGRRRRLCESVQ